VADFHLPAQLEAGQPPEARGLDRDQVRLMVSDPATNRVVHARFRDLPAYLRSGDVLLVNTSGTLNAALNARRQDGLPLEMHLSTHLPGDLWIVELRQAGQGGLQPFYSASAGEGLSLPGGGRADLLTPYRPEQRMQQGISAHIRLWIAALQLPLPLEVYLARYGFPIRYKYVHQEWPLSYYQTVFASEMGSAEMPSAGRPFTCPLLDQLEQSGVKIAPLLLHTGVASLEDGEPPYEEYYRVPVETAQAVNDAHAAGKRVIAVGTTCVRAIETVASPQGQVHPGEGWTRLVITPQRGVYAVNGLLTGFHEPQSTHLAMLEAIASADHLRVAYRAALEQGYLWHEFGDLHFILPPASLAG
jgi:S-adenosylmethionine:tRNA ribosyltransferase-isomerase